MDTGPAEPAAPKLAWWHALPPADAEVRCGEAQHAVRWADGALSLLAHPDAEAELVLGALGGESQPCVELAGMWERHTGNLDVLMFGPRSAADRVQITAKDLAWTPAIGLAGLGGLASVGGLGGRGPLQAVQHHVVTALQGTATSPSAFAAPADPERERQWSLRIEMLSLFALGPAFQIRLTGVVADAWSSEAKAGDRAANRPRLAAALTGRLAPAAESWLGIDPDLVTATVHEGPGWGSLKVTDGGDGRTLRASLPLTWLSGVWAAGLAVVEGNLVVAVRAARWPDAEVLAMPEPGADPVVLRLRGSVGAGGPGTGPHWAVTGSGGPEVAP
jgi:hypothetical protein